MKMTHFSLISFCLLAVFIIKDRTLDAFLRKQYSTTSQYNKILDIVCQDALYAGIIGDEYGKPVIDRQLVTENFYKKLSQSFLVEGTEAERKKLFDCVLALCFVKTGSYFFYTKEDGFSKEIQAEGKDMVYSIQNSFEKLLAAKSRGSRLGISYKLVFPSIEDEEAYQTILPDSLLCIFETAPIYPEKEKFWRVVISGSRIRKTQWP